MQEWVDAFDLPPAVVAVMMQRGIHDVKTAEEFLDPRLKRLTNPFRLPDMEKAVDRIWKALLAGERILVFGDYDVDGVTSTTLLSQVLQMAGGTVDTFIPHRIEDGYGLSVDALSQRFDEAKPGLIITVDCGTGSVDAVRFAAEQGVDVIVTDHHEASGEVAPAVALVNPKLGDQEDLMNLAGVGVAFKLCHALQMVGKTRKIEGSHRIDLRPLMYLVALGTVADMVPLIGENRILARYGITVLNMRRAPGIDALAQVAGIQQEMTSYHIGFVLGPRINAAGRMQSPETALNLLLAKDHVTAVPLAEKLESANRERQGIEHDILNQALEDINKVYDPNQPSVLVVGRRNWHPGVVGIVASRLVRRFHRPAIVIAFDEKGMGRGSCRSIETFDLITHLQKADQFLDQYGGHRMAAGLDIAQERVDEFREAMCKMAANALNMNDLMPTQHVDGWIELDDLTDEFMHAQNRLMPFGHSNAPPVWGVRNAKVLDARIVGKRHLKLLIDTPNGAVDAIGFGMADREPPAGLVDLAFQLRNNVFRGEERLQLMLQDFRSVS